MLHAYLWPDTATVGDNGHLRIGGCDVVALARAHGTPLYLLDEATFRANCRAYQAAFTRHYPAASMPHYASKALLNTAVAQLVAEEGLGLDVVSGGELHVALRARFPAARIHLHGNAKPRPELEQALAAGVGNIVVDTLDELELLAELTTGRPSPQSIMLRLSPDVAADTHAHIETGRATSKFGLPLGALDAAADRIAATPGLRLSGLHAHLGSQIFDARPMVQAIDVLLDCAMRLRDMHGIATHELSPGGGVGVPYTSGQQPPDLEAYVKALADALTGGCAARGMPLPKLVIEPGRSIVARAGVAIYTVVATKPLATTGGASATRYLHVDGGMADNIRPSLYAARYTALLANRAKTPADERVHVAGRFCESGDVLLKDALLPQAMPGDLIAVAVAGAYTLSMSSNYNLVPRPALVLVGNGQTRLIQRRETYDDLVVRDLAL
jgi:diaminopimelate decarboxylase